MIQQMSVEWLIDQLHSHIGHIDVLDVAELNGYFDKAKEMNKVQNMYFFNCGRQYQLTGEGTFTQVYNETFNK
jgi:hypothetical protein